MSSLARSVVVRGVLTVPLLLSIASGAVALRPGTEGVAIAGSSWLGEATLKGKVAGPGGSNSIAGPVFVWLAFGPSPVLDPGEFSIEVDDGVDVLVFGGTYVEPNPGKAQLLPSPTSYELAWCELFYDYFGVDDCDFDLTTFKATAKVKSTALGDILKLKFGAKSRVTISLGGETGVGGLKIGVKGLMTPD